jgi:mannosyl-3-phosphoglycerate phosphatase
MDAAIRTTTSSRVLGPGGGPGLSIGFFLLMIDSAIAKGLIIFTDLDGSLLDHADYSFAGAASALAALKETDVPLVMTTSKTRPEVEELQNRLGMVHPFIVENGGGIFFPPGYPVAASEGTETAGPYQMVRLGEPYQRIRDFFATVREPFQLRGFGDMDVAEIKERTGLSLRAAQMAGCRDFSEPFVFIGPERIMELTPLATRAGLSITRGGRFYHLIGSGQSKGRAVRIATRILRQHKAGRVTTVGLGDSKNDLPMLAEVDIAILIPHPDGTHEPLALPGLRRVDLPGSAGWGKAVLEILDATARHG